ncbi:MAG: serine/threonine-protein kinase RsbW [Thalassolituus oleivorans]|jgi:serine/threonine-protein kinase RsbW
MERAFPRDIAALDSIFAYLDEYAGQAALSPAVSFPISMAVEELFTNMVKYNSLGAGEIVIGISGGPESVEVVLVDSDSAPFDVTANQRVDTSAPLEARTPGGLGLHLVQRMMDEIYYEHKKRRTQIRLVKYLR